MLTPRDPANAEGLTNGSSRDRPIESRRRQLETHRRAITGANPMFRLMAHALAYLTDHVATFVATYALVDQSPTAYVVGPCLISADAPDAPSAERLYEQALAHADLDPLLRPVLKRRIPQLVCLEDAGGERAYNRSPFARVFRETFGIGPRLRLFLRERSKLVAAISLMRRTNEPDFSAEDRSFLLASHEFLEAVHLVAVRRARAEGRVQHLARTLRFSVHERELTRLILSGASNTQIAEELSVTVETVRRNLRQLYTKLSVGNRSELAALMLEHPEP